MRRKLIPIVLSLAVLTAACGGDEGTSGKGQAVENPDLTAEIRMAASEDAWPTEGKEEKSTTFAYPLNVNVYEPLIYLSSDYTLRPGLAERWELVNNGKTWRFHLRRGVKFHDGSDFNADDVMWTWDKRQVEMGAHTLSTVSNTLGPDSVQKVDDFTVDFTPVTPNLRIPEQIVHPEGAIVPEGKHFDASPPVGSGPFRVASYTPNQSVVVERYEGYWGDKPKAKRLNIRFLPDPQSRIEALRSGQVDFIDDVQPGAVASLEGSARFRIVKSDPGRNQLIYVNKTGKAPYDLGADPAIREAVALALDRRTYVDTIFEGNANPGRWMAPKSVLGAAADTVAAVPFDAARARKVLDDAGWRPGPDGIRAKDGRRLTLTIIGWEEIPDEAFQFIQSQLKDVGIELNIKKAPDRPTYRTYYQNTEFDLDLEVPNQNDGNPAFLPVLRMYSKNSGTNRFAPNAAPQTPNGPEFDARAEKALAATSTPEVQRASAEMMEILINQDHIVVPVAGVFRIYGMTSNVGLGDPHPSQTNQSWASLAKSANGG